jgi:DNA-binding CsgD family transcriptional regulator
VLRIPSPATYDRARSRERRCRLAYSGPMPAHLAQSFTPAEVAVLRIIADEHRDRSGCDRSVDEIAARAGVCRRTVQNALRHAERLGLVSITERRVVDRRNLPNIVRVVSREWLAWIEHHSKTRVRHGRASVPAARHGVRDVAHEIGCRTVHPTDKACSFKGIEGRKSE